MKRVSFFLYGTVCYAIFFVTFLYSAGFAGNLLMPKSVDNGTQGGESNAWLVDIFVQYVGVVLPL